jgi:ATP-dependent Lon protease
MYCQKRWNNDDKLNIDRNFGQRNQSEKRILAGQWVTMNDDAFVLLNEWSYFFGICQMVKAIVLLHITFVHNLASLHTHQKESIVLDEVVHRLRRERPNEHEKSKREEMNGYRESMRERWTKYGTTCNKILAGSAPARP